MARKSSAADAALRATLHRDALREEANALADARPRNNRGGRLDAWERDFAALGKRLDRAERAAREANRRARISEPAPAPERKRKRAEQPKKERAAKKKPAAKPAPKPAREEEEGAPAWEIGVNYKSDRKPSSVMVNIRIESRDGEPISRSEAKRVMKLLHNGATPDRLPANITVTGVDWSRPKWGGDMRSGDEPATDLYNFRYVLGSVPDDQYRLNIPDEPFQ